MALVVRLIALTLLGMTLLPDYCGAMKDYFPNDGRYPDEPLPPADTRPDKPLVPDGLFVTDLEEGANPSGKYTTFVNPVSTPEDERLYGVRDTEDADEYDAGQSAATDADKIIEAYGGKNVLNCWLMRIHKSTSGKASPSTTLYRRARDTVRFDKVDFRNGGWQQELSTVDHIVLMAEVCLNAVNDSDNTKIGDMFAMLQLRISLTVLFRGGSLERVPLNKIKNLGPVVLKGRNGGVKGVVCMDEWFRHDKMRLNELKVIDVDRQYFNICEETEIADLKLKMSDEVEYRRYIYLAMAAKFVRLQLQLVGKNSGEVLAGWKVNNEKRNFWALATTVEQANLIQQFLSKRDITAFRKISMYTCHKAAIFYRASELFRSVLKPFNCYYVRETRENSNGRTPNKIQVEDEQLAVRIKAVGMEFLELPDCERFTVVHFELTERQQMNPILTNLYGRRLAGCSNVEHLIVMDAENGILGHTLEILAVDKLSNTNEFPNGLAKLEVVDAFVDVVHSLGHLFILPKTRILRFYVNNNKPDLLNQLNFVIRRAESYGVSWKKVTDTGPKYPGRLSAFYERIKST